MASDGATIVVTDSATDSVVLATNSTNAINKNWKVKYNSGSNADFPTTNGTYVWGSYVDLSYIASDEITLYPTPTKNEVTIRGGQNELVKVILWADLLSKRK